MKPLKLVMSAFGPFSKVVEVPFEEFGTSGLFLVTGDTGAGKTTIFDAISFALFGNASGENRTADCFRSDFAGSEDKTYVELTFLHKGKTYQITRNPMYKRTKISGTGTTEEKPNATLILPGGAVVSGNSKVTEAIVELLGIDWKQFKQIAMIAQGEFLQLLTANSNERGLIFRKVFGTQIYEDIQKKLKTMANELKYRCEDLDKSILQFLSGIVCDTESVHYDALTDWNLKKDINQVQKVMELLTVMINSDHIRYKEEDQKNQLLTIKMKEKAAEYTTAKTVNQSFINLKRAREEQEGLLLDFSNMKKKEIILQLAKKALYTVKPVEEICLRVKKDFTSLSEDIEKQSLQMNKLEVELTLHKEILKTKETTKPRINELTAKISRQEADLSKYDTVASLIEEQTKLSNDKLQLEERLVRFNTMKAELISEQQEKQSELDKYRNVDRDLLDVQNQLKQNEASINHLKEFFAEYIVLENEQNTLLLWQKDYQESEQFYNDKNVSYLALEALFLREQAGIIATALQDGSPCPVCGSTDHPLKAVLTEGAPSEEQLNKEKVQLEKAHKAMTVASGKCQSQLTAVEIIQRNLQKRATEQLMNWDDKIASLEIIHTKLQQKLLTEKLIQTELQTKAKALIKDLESKKLCEQRIVKVNEELVKQEELITKNKEETETISNKISSLAGMLITHKADLIYPSKAVAKAALELDRKEYTDLQLALVQAEEAHHICEANLGKVKAVLADNRSKHASKAVELGTAEQDLIDKLHSNGFAELTDYKESLLTETELEMQVQQLNLYNKNCERLEKLVEQLVAETKEKEEKDLFAIQAEQEELDLQKKASDEVKQDIFTRLKMNSEILNNSQDKYKEQEKTRQEYMTLSDLSKTANGELSGKAKIAFEQYVQAFYFGSVINEANKRLYKMSNSQFSLLRKEDASNLRSACGLELEVMDYYTGKPRSVKSLSGGESFKAALSLALGLSDVIQSFAGGIEVDAMFIDEGFGSLDSNSLEQAIDTLNALTMGNRFVGIISHVSELKERIDKKIAITKSIDGSRLVLIK